MATRNSEAKIAVITGCTRGLGRAMVEKLHDLGWRIAGCGRSKEKITELAELFPDRGLFRVVNVSDDEEMAAFAGEVLAKFGPPDLLLNNAGVINHEAALWDVPATEFAQVIEVNIIGVANSIRHFTPPMIDASKGVIVNFSSGWGRSTSPGVAPYCATKFAVEGLTSALSQDLPKGLAAVALNPGIINTEMLQTCFGEDARAYPTAVDWAETAVPFLLKLGAKDNGEALTAP